MFSEEVVYKNNVYESHYQNVLTNNLEISGDNLKSEIRNLILSALKGEYELNQKLQAGQHQNGHKRPRVSWLKPHNGQKMSHARRDTILWWAEKVPGKMTEAP